ncbi:hypothetical protein H5410_036403 [Solanum commersonii]|uniref:Uncharacterized protein n=1 Tax=Solanum commersonii TaxID=4109 RepID=A0A9J5Y3F7_SOLCO|nr:hypothetical protein H5410_036403 [Solanum commersonii]
MRKIKWSTIVQTHYFTITFLEKESATWYNYYMYSTAQHDNEPIQDIAEVPSATTEIVVDENLRFEQFLARHKS